MAPTIIFWYKMIHRLITRFWAQFVSRQELNRKTYCLIKPLILAIEVEKLCKNQHATRFSKWPWAMLRKSSFFSLKMLRFQQRKLAFYNKQITHRSHAIHKQSRYSIYFVELSSEPRPIWRKVKVFVSVSFETWFGFEFLLFDHRGICGWNTYANSYIPSIAGWMAHPRYTFQLIICYHNATIER